MNIRYQEMFDVEKTHWWYRGLRCILFYWIEKLAPKKILDEGCGTGMNMWYLKKMGYQTAGVDISQTALQFAKKRGLKNLKLASADSLPYKKSTFDCIICLDVLGCLSKREVEKALKEMRRCLTPSGHVIIQVAALPGLYASQDVLWGIKHRYYKQEFTNIVKAEGFTVITANYRVFFLFPFVLLIKLLDKLYMKFRGARPAGDTAKTNSLLNAILTPIMVLEGFLSRYVSFPIGTSVFLVARKRRSY